MVLKDDCKVVLSTSMLLKHKPEVYVKWYIIIISIIHYIFGLKIDT